MSILTLIAEAPDVDFTSPGYSTGTELPPVSVNNLVEEIPFESSALNSETLMLVIAGLLFLFIVIIICFVVFAIRKNRNVSDFAGFEEEPVEILGEEVREEVNIKEKPQTKKVAGSKLSTPQNLKLSIKSFLERTQNL